MRVLQANWRCVEVVDLRLQDWTSREILKADQILVRYAPLRLLHRQVDSVLLSGLRTHLPLETDGVSIGEAVSSPGGKLKTNWQVSEVCIEDSAVGIGWNRKVVNLPFELDARMDPDGEYQFVIRAAPFDAHMVITGILDAVTGAGSIVLAPAELPLGRLLEFAGVSPGGGWTGSVRAVASMELAGWAPVRSEVKLEAQVDSPISVPPLTLVAQYEKLEDGSWKAKGQSSQDWAVTIPPLNIAADRSVLSFDLGGTHDEIAGRLKWDCNAMTIQSEKMKNGPIRFTNPSLDVPIQWPLITGDPQGECRADALQVAPLHVNRLAGRFHKQGLTLVVTGRGGLALPGLSLDWEVVLGKEGLMLDFAVPETILSNKTDLGMVWPKAAGITVWGGLVGRGRAAFSSDATASTGAMVFSGLNAEWKDKSSTLTGLDGVVAFSNLIFALTDGPQMVRWNRVQAGTLAFSNGMAVFSTGGANALDIEQVSADFCGGRLSISNLQIGAGTRRVEGLLRCDGVRLAPLLNLLGWVRVEGTGELGGYLPFHLWGEKLTIDESSVSTPPGESGTLRILDSGFLVSGLPTNNPGYVYASIAEEALKDFRYDEARLDLHLTNGMLNAVLKVRGAPNRRLPFSYDLQQKQFVRTDPLKSNANFDQGIELNVRLNDLSIDDLLGAYPDEFF